MGAALPQPGFPLKITGGTLGGNIKVDARGRLIRRCDSFKFRQNKGDFVRKRLEIKIPILS